MEKTHSITNSCDGSTTDSIVANLTDTNITNPTETNEFNLDSNEIEKSKPHSIETFESKPDSMEKFESESPNFTEKVKSKPNSTKPNGFFVKPNLENSLTKCITESSKSNPSDLFNYNILDSTNPKLTDSLNSNITNSCTPNCPISQHSSNINSLIASEDMTSSNSTFSVLLDKVKDMNSFQMPSEMICNDKIESGDSHASSCLQTSYSHPSSDPNRNFVMSQTTTKSVTTKSFIVLKMENDTKKQVLQSHCPEQPSKIKTTSNEIATVLGPGATVSLANCDSQTNTTVPINSLSNVKYLEDCSKVSNRFSLSALVKKSTATFGEDKNEISGSPSNIKETDDLFIEGLNSVRLQTSVCVNKASVAATRKSLEAAMLATSTIRKPKKVPIFVRKMKNLNVTEGCIARFEVLVDGNPDPNVVWLKDGIPITNDATKYIKESFLEGRFALLIRDCGEDDDAEYGCRALNALGEVYSKAELYVEPAGEKD